MHALINILLSWDPKKKTFLKSIVYCYVWAPLCCSDVMRVYIERARAARFPRVTFPTCLTRFSLHFSLSDVVFISAEFRLHSVAAFLNSTLFGCMLWRNQVFRRRRVLVLGLKYRVCGVEICMTEINALYTLYEALKKLGLSFTRYSTVSARAQFQFQKLSGLTDGISGVRFSRIAGGLA